MKNILKNYPKAVKHLILVFAFLITVALQNCGSDEPTPAQARLEMKATTALSSFDNGRTKVVGLEFTEVLIGVTEIELETLEENQMEDSGDFEDMDGDHEDDNEEIEFEGNFIVDLITGTSTPDFGLADLEPAIYEELEIEMDNILEGGHTIFIALNFIPDGAAESVRVEYSYDDEMEIEIENDAGFSIDEGTVNNLLLLLDLDALFDGLNLNDAQPDTDGVIRINDQSNSNLAETISNNFEEALEAGEDENDDDELDD